MNCGPWCVVAVWSAVNVAGTRLRDIAPQIGTIDDPENWEEVHVDVINRYVVSAWWHTEINYWVPVKLLLLRNQLTDFSAVS